MRPISPRLRTCLGASGLCAALLGTTACSDPARTEPLAAAGPTPATLAAPPSPDSYVMVLVDLGAGVDITPAQANAFMFSTTPADRSLASWYNESSYGKYTITGSVVGPVQYSMTTCDTAGMAASIESTQNLSAYNHIVYYFRPTTLCTFGSLGEEGSVGSPARRVWLNGYPNCPAPEQETGRNLGLMHANTISCGGLPFSTTPATTCTIAEYGDPLTVMGQGCRQHNGYEKWYEQWLSGCNGVRVTSTGTFTLSPLGESCPGAPQVLQIPMSAPLTVYDPQSPSTAVNLRNYYVDFRAAAGQFDQYDTGSGQVTYTGPTVTIYVGDDVPTGSSSSVYTYLLDMMPGGLGFTGLTSAGQSFTDPAGGATITLNSIKPTGSSVAAVVQVTIPGGGAGGPTCIDQTILSGTPTCSGSSSSSSSGGSSSGSGSGSGSSSSGSSSGSSGSASGSSGGSGSSGSSSTSGSGGSGGASGSGGGSSGAGSASGSGGSTGSSGANGSGGASGSGGGGSGGSSGSSGSDASVSSSGASGSGSSGGSSGAGGSGSGGGSVSSGGRSDAGAGGGAGDGGSRSGSSGAGSQLGSVDAATDGGAPLPGPGLWCDVGPLGKGSGSGAIGPLAAWFLLSRRRRRRPER